MTKGSTSIKRRWPKEFMDEINVQFVKFSLEKKRSSLKNEKKYYRIVRYGHGFDHLV
jgi:hypothetical protein